MKTFLRNLGAAALGWVVMAAVSFVLPLPSSGAGSRRAADRVAAVGPRVQGRYLHCSLAAAALW